MSTKVVVPESIISRHARRVPHRTKSGVTFLASAGKDEFVQPVLHLHVVGDAAEQRHGGVGVGVDQARHQDGVRAVEVLAGLKLLLDVGALADANDALAANGDRAVVDQVALRVHGDDVAGGVDGVGRLGVSEGRIQA